MILQSTNPVRGTLARRGLRCKRKPAMRRREVLMEIRRQLLARGSKAGTPPVLPDVYAPRCSFGSWSGI